MWISNFAIDRPVITIVLMLALVIFGAFALTQLETDEFPEIDAPVVGVTVLYPGASPAVVEQEVVKPLEDAIASISGVDRITSTSVDGFGQIIIEFVFDKPSEQATQDVRDAFSRIRGELPLEMEEPILTHFDPADFPIVSLTLSSPAMSVAQLTALADDVIEPELRGLPGVADVVIQGGLERQVVIEVKAAAMQAAGVSIGQVVQAVQSQNLAAPVGRIEQGFIEQSIRLRARIARPEEFSAIVLSSQNGRLVRLSEIATVRDATEEQRTLALYGTAKDGDQEAVGIDIKKAQGNSTTAVAERVLQRVELLNRRLPPNVKVNVIRNSGDRVQDSVDSVVESLIEGLLLTVITVFVFLNSWRSTVITGLALPVSLMSAFVAVWLFGFTLNTMSLLGLALAVGILIDDAIVVRENIVRHVEMGKDHRTASREGTAEIGLAVAATTFSIVVVFVPIALISGVAGQWFRPFALTIACAVLVSLLVSFSLDPMLSAYWPDPHTEKKRWLTRKLDAFNAWFDRQAVRYQGVIGWTLDHPWVTIGIAALTFFAALAMPAMGLVGQAFFPVQDVSEFTLSVDTPPGSSLAYTRMKAAEAAATARAQEGVAYTYTTIGGQSGAVDEASIFVRLHPRAEREIHQTEIERAVRRAVERIGGARIGIGGNDMGGGQAQIQLQVKGPDVDTLMQLADRVAAEMRQVPGAADVAISTKTRRPEIEVEIDRALAGSFGIDMTQVAMALRIAFAGVDSGDWLTPEGDAYDVYVRLDPKERRTIADLASLPLGVIPQSTAAAPVAGPVIAPMVPLGQIAEIKQGVGPGEIQRLDRERVVTVGANAEGRPLSAVIGGINQRIATIQLPAGYTIGQGGEAESQAEVFGDMLAAMGMAVLLMYFVLVLQFESFLDPFAIMLSLPLSLIGVMLALALTRDTLNIMSMIGVLLLMGIVAKNAILLIDFAKWRTESGMPLRDALIEAGRIRLRPILMTSFALIAGMIPVAMGIGEGAEFRAPMGRAVIGGVVTSTLLTLIVIPSIYELMDKGRGRFMRRFRRTAHVTPDDARSPSS